jgi:hypothetical protein
MHEQGGSGLIIPLAAPKRAQDLGFELLTRMVDAAQLFGLAISSPPPYESMWLEEPWSTAEWSDTLLQMKASVPPTYPGTRTVRGNVLLLQLLELL